MVECDNCAERFNAVAHRWRCPACGFKMSCCDGAPLSTLDKPSRQAVEFGKVSAGRLRVDPERLITVEDLAEIRERLVDGTVAELLVERSAERARRRAQAVRDLRDVTQTS